MYTYLEDSNDIGQVIEAIFDSLRLWRAEHYDVAMWVQSWTEIYEQLPDTIGNDYFSFDLREAALRAYVSQFDWYLHPEEGLVEEPEDDEGNELEEVDPFEYGIEGMFYGWDIPQEYYQEAMAEAFEAYAAGVHPYTDGIKDEIDIIVKRYEESDEPQDDMLAALVALAIYHTSGNIIEDYGDSVGLDFSLAYDIRENGFVETFGEDEVAEFMFG